MICGDISWKKAVLILLIDPEHAKKTGGKVRFPITGKVSYDDRSRLIKPEVYGDGLIYGSGDRKTLSK